MRWFERFSLPRGERRVLLPLLILLVAAFVLLLLFGGRQSAGNSADNDGPHLLLLQDSLRQDSLWQNGSRHQNGSRQYERTSREPLPEPAEVHPFPFDPNTADSVALRRLGLAEWQVRSLYHYRAAGGIFREKEDFARLYGLTVGQYRRLEPYIRIGDDYRPASTLFPERKQDRFEHTGKRGNQDTLQVVADSTGTRHRYKLMAGETIDLNVGDTAVYRRVPGIGSYYARRIADYGKRLGGYVSIAQLDEIDDFPSEAKAFFTVSEHPLQPLYVNRLSLNELKRHPYINYYQARCIVEYRRLYGPLHNLNELRLLPEFTEKDFIRLSPYVDYSK